MICRLQTSALIKTVHRYETEQLGAKELVKRDIVREAPRGREGMVELTVPSHHGNPFDMQLPYLLPTSELYSAIYFVSLYKRYRIT